MANSQQPMDAVVKSVNDFTLDLYLHTAEVKGPGKNILVSPLSAALVTAMVHAGAKGETAKEIGDILHFPKEKEVLEQGFSDLHKSLANTQNVTLEIANRIYLEKSRELKKDYNQTVSKVHNSDIEKADFIYNAEKERGTINGWVSKKTHDKINDLIPPGVLSSATRLVLVNAVYFYGKWKEQFDRAQTYDEDFYVTKENKVKVPMMHMTKNLRYAQIPELDATAVELCYANERVCLQIILPNARDGLSAMQQKLRAGEFDLSTIQFYSTKVQLSMPKFKIEETMNIKEIYQKMGIKKMFSDQADLTGMVEGESLAVSDAIQKTFMDVNEEGTEAAAATGIVVVLESLLRYDVYPQEFLVKRPFFVRLVDRLTKATVVIARIVNPRP